METWKGDKDFIVMWHRFGFQIGGKHKSIISHLTVTGENGVETAMAKTVGIPLGIATKLLLQGKIKKNEVLLFRLTKKSTILYWQN